MKTMSRFGLRRGFKLSEEQVNGKNPIIPIAAIRTSVAGPSGRKKRQLRYEPDDEEEEQQQPLPLEGEQKQEHEKEEGSSAQQQPSLICRLPLERLPRLVEKLQLLMEEQPRERDLDLDSGHGSGSGSGLKKVLCLYCDRKFASGKLQGKHVEKFHTERQDRRCSGRSTTSSVNSHPPGGFPNCQLCSGNKKHSMQPQICLPVKHLDQLFFHLIKMHADKYFACHPCRLRFHDPDQLTGHRRQHHQLEEPPSPKPGLMGADEPVLFRLGLTQNRLPSHRNRQRRAGDDEQPALAMPHKSRSSSRAAAQRQHQQHMTVTTIQPVGQGHGQDHLDAPPDAVFRQPSSSACVGVSSSCNTSVSSHVFDENFYKDVILNVQQNLQNYLDGRLFTSPITPASTSSSSSGCGSSYGSTSTATFTSDLVMLHGSSQMSHASAYPTLLTSEQFGSTAELLPPAKFRRRPHTKHSWKWKWDYVKKFTIINEGGRLVKKLKQPTFPGLRDLSKLDMWTQLTMRQKHDVSLAIARSCNGGGGGEDGNHMQLEQQRLLEQLNLILDHRLLPHIILEQNEQAIIKCENEDDANLADCGSVQGVQNDLLAQNFADESFLSLLQLKPRQGTSPERIRDGEREQDQHKKITLSSLVLSGEWARPRLYLCICCGAKFDQRKSLEEHKTFRHSHIYATHYEVVGRELLAGNLLRHLFIPKRALGRFAAESNCIGWPQHKQEERVQPEEETTSSSTSSRSSFETSTPTNTPTPTPMSGLEQQQASPASGTGMTSSSSCSLSSSSTSHSHSTPTCNTANTLSTLSSSSPPSICTKCGRKCSGLMDLYRHMLDCSGDYIWSLAKKRKYRYYCGTKKRRPCSKKPIRQLSSRKKLEEKLDDSLEAEGEAENENEDDGEEEGEGEESGSNSSKTKNSSRQRPSDAESIRKMLENLPPKRVCKKIFPVDNKAKRKSKNKSKSMLKQQRSTKKIYNQHLLRNTRSSVVAAASAAALAAGQQKRCRRKQQQKLQKKQQKKSKLGAGGDCRSAAKSPLSLSIIELEPQAQPEPQAHSQPQPQPQPDVKPEATFTANLRSPINFKPALAILQAADSDTAPTGEVPPAPIATSQELESEGFTRHEKREAASPTPSKQLMPTPPATPAPVPAIKSLPVAPRLSLSSRQSSSNAGVKRSKRISDCIAMLTGKLEEKLKTEQVPLPAPPPPQPRAPPPSVTEKEEEKDCNIHTESTLSPNAAAGKELLEVKTPKRKAMSRRIIKVDAALGTRHDAEPASEPLEKQKAAVSELVHAARPGLAGLVSVPAPVPVSQPTSAPARVLPVHSALLALRTTMGRTPTKEGTKQLAVPTTPSPTAATLKQYPAEQPQPQPKPVTALVPVPMPVPMPMPLELQGMGAPLAGPGSVSAIPVHGNMNLLPKLPLYLPHAQPHPHANQNSNPNVNPTMYLMETQPLNLTSQRGCLQKPMLPSTERDGCHTGLHYGRSSGLPARRQTICGFEARNVLVLEMDMEPLDLSKKSARKSSPASVAAPMRVAQEMSVPRSMPMPMQMQIPMPLPLPLVTAPAGSSDPLQALPVPLLGPSAGAALGPVSLASHYYSNLDLLKIPQVRNPGTATGTGTGIGTGTGTGVSSSNVILSAAAAIPVHLPKASGGKKRSVEATGSKREYGGKGLPKGCLRMDEVVNNHIDDAINSVILAVQASLPDDDDKETEQERERESEKQKNFNLPLEVLHPTRPTNYIVATAAVTATGTATTTAAGMLFTSTSFGEKVAASSAGTAVPPQTTTPGKTLLTPKKRSMRSKTIDCRSGLLATEELPAKQLPLLQCLQLQSVPPVNEEVKADARLPRVYSKVPVPDSVLASEQVPAQAPSTVEEPPPYQCISEDSPKMVLEQQLQPELEMEQHARSLPDPFAVVETLPLSAPSVAVSVISIAPALPLRMALTPTPTVETNCSSLLEEHSSNMNNNTSSGFHSLAQSELPSAQDQSATGASTLKATEELPAKEKGKEEQVVEEQVVKEQVPVTKKKQRRRRKNELAAIVADQLLESFKIDNARRDNLKKLENLAYEKSEDLLLTGMLLMSSTKRNAAMAPTSTSISTSKLSRNSTAKEAAEVAPTPPVRGRPKRRQSCYYRSRGKAAGGKATNENISMLKSTLESFSIGIEKQLLAKEAKEAKDAGALPAVKNAGQPLGVSILRPSILSSAAKKQMYQKREAELELQKEKERTIPATAATFSRDPRLNKNIHKEQPDHIQPPTRAAAPTQNVPAAGDNADEEDNYLTEIAKNVNEKIMSATTNEDFEFAHDVFDQGEQGGRMDMDPDQDKFYRPPTSMSVRSAPNLNDEHSNFGSTCDENTNTELMDMDLDDEMSVYTSYSQDLGRGGRGRRRRRRRSILLTRPKKRTQRSHADAVKYSCSLCGKSFFTATSLSKHNMTLAHVSKLSEQEYLQSQTAPSSPRVLEVQLDLEQGRGCGEKEIQMNQQATTRPTQQIRASVLMPPSQIIPQVEHQQQQQEQQQQLNEQVHHVITEASLRLHDNQHSPSGASAARLNLNPDERLFYECCNILKSAETPRLSSSTTPVAVPASAQPPSSSVPATTSVIVTAGRKQPPPPPASPPPQASPSLSPPASPALSPSLSPPASPSPLPPSSPTPPPHPFPPLHGSARMPGDAAPTVCHQPVIQQLFRNPPAATPSTTPTNHNRMSPSYSAISQFSATTSRFKTKAAMKGYENVSLQLDIADLPLVKTGRGVCKLTELADIALGSEKPGSDFMPHLSQGILPCTGDSVVAAAPSASHEHHMHQQQQQPLPHPHLQPTPTPTGTHTGRRTTTTPTPMPTLMPTPTPARPVEQQSSTSSKTIMHASIIKAVAGVASSATLPPACGRIIIPERPFKNIGLEEKASITFQKPKTCVNLLQEQDSNSVSTASYSDRDDYDFGTLSCDGDVEPDAEQEPDPRARCDVRPEAGLPVEVLPGAEETAVSSSSSSTSSSSSQENTRTRSRSSSSSRATAKTFENKSLIMGRIFKHASSKAASAAAPVQQLPSSMPGPALAKIKALPKNQANLDQIFDELRGGGAAKASEVESPVGLENWDRDHPQPHTQPHPHLQQEPMAAPAVPTVPAAMPAPSGLPRSRTKKIKIGPPAHFPKNIVKPPESSPTPVLSASASPSPLISPSASASASSPLASLKPRKDLSKLQSELGMSPEEIEQLIDEGQRKSKRRCATNRPKKLVETWSSDEYEEFLSTKDIIALIEQKEQQEQRRKRKTSEANVNQPELIWTPAAPKKTPTPSAIARRKKGAVKKAPLPVLNHPKPATTAKARQRANPNPRPAPVPEQPPKSKSKSKAPTKVKTLEAKSATYRKRRGNGIEIDKEKVLEPKTEPPARTRSSRQQVKDRPPPPAETSEVPLVEEPSQRLPQSFPMSATQRTKSRSSNNIVPPPPPPPAARSSSSATTNTNNNNNSSSSNKNLKTKRKSQTNKQSPARRKRPASEKQLYYWSSSSDDEFGRVEADGEPDAAVLVEQQKQERQHPEPLAGKHFEESEPYQKHGWIVGDSHKKLVKLLAIAKGSKKVENCGVKRRTPKRKC